MNNIGMVNRIVEKYRKNSLFIYAALGVCAAHLALISWIYTQTAFDTPKMNTLKHSVVVRTIKLNADKEKASPAGEKMIAEAPLPPSKAKPALPKEKIEAKKPEKKPEKKNEKPKIEKKKELPAIEKNPKANKEPEPKKDKKELDKAKKKLLQQVQESIANIEGRSDKLVATLKSRSKNNPATPGRVEGLSIEAKSFEGTSFNDKESAYSEELAGRIRLFMKLPEYGSVDVALVLKRSGEFVSLKILGSESARNKAYVEGVLPTVAFLPFGASFAKESTYTFHITLTNE